MDPLEDRVARIARSRDKAVRDFRAVWQKTMDEWNQPGTEARVWLIYSANYLFRTGEVRWALDPVRLKHRLPAAPLCDYAADLASLSLVLLTHEHADHLDIELIQILRDLPITWIVPEHLLKPVKDEGGVAAARIVVPEALQSMEFKGLRITPFEGMHWEELIGKEDGKRRGVPAAGYLIEFDGRRWLFPGDTRTYDASRLPEFEPIDALFAHVWLGRGRGLDAEPPLVDALCHFCLDLKPCRLLLTHLQEFGRDPGNYWDIECAGLVSSKIRELCPALQVTSAVMGDSILL
jgi:hypothetical protein